MKWNKAVVAIKNKKGTVEVYLHYIVPANFKKGDTLVCESRKGPLIGTIDEIINTDVTHTNNHCAVRKLNNREIKKIEAKRAGGRKMNMSMFTVVSFSYNGNKYQGLAYTDNDSIAVGDNIVYCENPIKEFDFDISMDPVEATGCANAKYAETTPRMHVGKVGKVYPKGTFVMDTTPKYIVVNTFNANGYVSVIGKIQKQQEIMIQLDNMRAKFEERKLYENMAEKSPEAAELLKQLDELSK